MAVLYHVTQHVTCARELLINHVRRSKKILRRNHENNAPTLLNAYYRSGLIPVYLERLFCFRYQTQLDLQRGGVYLLTLDTKFCDVTSPYLYKSNALPSFCRCSNKAPNS